jgi:hypothetical protein
VLNRGTVTAVPTILIARSDESDAFDDADTWQPGDDDGLGVGVVGLIAYDDVLGRVVGGAHCGAVNPAQTRGRVFRSQSLVVNEMTEKVAGRAEGFEENWDRTCGTDDCTVQRETLLKTQFELGRLL